MNGPQHYAAAERLLDGLGNSTRGTAHDASTLAEAQVHATLALAAAMAAGLPTGRHDWTQWSDAGAVTS